MELTGGDGRPAALGALVVLGSGADPADAPRADAGVEPASIRAGLRDLLPPHMVPERVVAVAELPLSANGKIDRRAAAALLQRESGGPRPRPSAPGSDLERMILMVWRAVLGGGEFGVTDEFFALGGDSVLATRVVAGLRDELDTDEVSVRMLFGAPTVAALAQRMRCAETAPGRLDRVASIAWEIAGLPDDEVARLVDGSDAGLVADDAGTVGAER